MKPVLGPPDLALDFDSVERCRMLEIAGKQMDYCTY